MRKKDLHFQALLGVAFQDGRQAAILKSNDEKPWGRGWKKKFSLSFENYSWEEWVNECPLSDLCMEWEIVKIRAV